MVDTRAVVDADCTAVPSGVPSPHVQANGNRKRVGQTNEHRFAPSKKAKAPPTQGALDTAGGMHPGGRGTKAAGTAAKRPFQKPVVLLPMREMRSSQRLVKLLTSHNVSCFFFCQVPTVITHF